MNGVPDPVVEGVGDDVADPVVEGAADLTGVLASELPLPHAAPKNMRSAITAAGVIRFALKRPFQ